MPPRSWLTWERTFAMAVWRRGVDSHSTFLDEILRETEIEEPERLWWVQEYPHCCFSLSLLSIFPVGDADLHPGNPRKSVTSVGTHTWYHCAPIPKQVRRIAQPTDHLRQDYRGKKANWCPTWRTFGLAVALWQVKRWTTLVRSSKAILHWATSFGLSPPTEL